MKVYYVYKLVDPDSLIPFYVGKGKDNRASSHLKLKEKSDNFRKDNKIREIYSRNKIPIIEYVHEFLDEETAYLKEEELIKHYGRIDFDKDGILTNITLNSRPPSQKGKKRVFSENHKKNLSNALRGKKKATPSWSKGLTKETDVRLKKLSENRKKTGNLHQKGMKYSEERINKIKEKLKGREISNSQREKMSLAKKGKTWEEIFGQEKANLMRKNKITGGDHHNAKKVHTPFGTFDTLTAAAKFINLSDATIRKKCKSDKDVDSQWYYILNTETL